MADPSNNGSSANSGARLPPLPEANFDISPVSGFGDLSPSEIESLQRDKKQMHHWLRAKMASETT